jgi:RNA polymerase sigma-70 factor (sigma-E family)
VSGVWGVAEPTGFADFVSARSRALHRTAYLLCLDQMEAEDLVQTALIKVWRAWGRIDDPEAYTRTTILRTFISSRRRRWWGERPTEEVGVTLAASSPDVDTTLDLARVVASLPPRQRAVIVLRFGHDLSEREVAEMLEVTVGTVKSQTSKALASLRRHPELHTLRTT